MAPYVDRLHAEINTAIWEHHQGSITTQQADWCTTAVMRSPLMARIIEMIEEDHVLELGPAGWSVEHPLACRLNGHSLDDCELLDDFRREVDRLADEWGFGRYRIWRDDMATSGFDGVPT